jgi:hypothetical protein
MTSEPGLVSRKIVEQGDEWVAIHEVWDTRVPGCPFVVVNPDPLIRPLVTWETVLSKEESAQRGIEP